MGFKDFMKNSLEKYKESQTPEKLKESIKKEKLKTELSDLRKKRFDNKMRRFI